MKNYLTNIFFIIIAFVCFSVSASAQKQDDKNNDKRNPPVINPSGDRKPKPDKPKESDKDKKTQYIFILLKSDK